MHKRYFSDKVVKWYNGNKRNLPWRHTRDPYKIWLSEIILQQTRVNQGLPYYQQFVKNYPTISALAAASEESVLRLWQGLGYYTRARNLHKCAQVIVHLHGSKFPSTYQQLLTLPGIGEYTAAAIASFAFKEKVAVVDGNVFRVLARNFGIDLPINTPGGKQVFSTLANELIDSKNPDIHNQAVMEFGATFCTPLNPPCEECIFQKSCQAYAHGRQHELPVKLRSKKARSRYFYYFVAEHGNKLQMKKRTEKDIWNGLFDFHLVEKTRPVKIEALLKDDSVKKITQGYEPVKVSKAYKHVLSHQVIHSTFIVIKKSKKASGVLKNHSFYSFEELEQLPKPVLVTKFLRDHYLL